MEENNIYGEFEPVSEQETEAEVTVEPKVVVEADVEPETKVEEGKKKRIPGWVIAIIVFVSIAMLGTAVFVGTFITRRIIRRVNFHAMPGGSITFSEENPAENVAKSALMGVVNIESTAGYNGFFGYSIGNETGAGVIIREDGYIITSLQLAENSGEITVKLQDGRRLPAMVESVDNINGMALLKVEATGLDTIAVGDSSVVTVGDKVAVISNRLSNNLTNPVTIGYVCGVDNGVGLDNGNYINLFQVDASGIAGSVGGIVINSKGELIGISNGIISNSSTEIGLVTPVNDLAGLLSGIVEVSNASVGSDLKIGFAGTDESYGVSVSMVGEGTPAEKAGLKVDDLIVKVDGETVTTVAKINEIKTRHVKGDTIVLTVYREGEMIDLNVVL